ncbi:MAG TPA: hypothetical protein VKT82_01710 [Ktedonobacterales bacterium]|nr:hypothetical protein [Ktedonobacterales bacterium]
MRAEPPDPLTTQMWQRLSDAKTSTMPPAEVIEALTLSLRRDVASPFASGEARQTHRV